MSYLITREESNRHLANSVTYLTVVNDNEKALQEIIVDAAKVIRENDWEHIETNPIFQVWDDKGGRNASWDVIDIHSGRWAVVRTWAAESCASVECICSTNDYNTAVLSLDDNYEDSLMSYQYYGEPWIEGSFEGCKYMKTESMKALIHYTLIDTWQLQKNLNVKIYYVNKN